MGLASLGGFGSFLGAASVELVGDTRPLVASLEKAKVETKAATTEMSAATAKSSSVMTAAWQAAGIAVAAFLVSSVIAAERYQEALAKLTAVAGTNTDAFLKLAEAQSNLTGFTTTATIQAEANLAVLHLTQAQMAKLLPVVEDYARFTGQDLPAAAANFEKGMLGNTRMLKSVGVEMSKAKFESLSFDQKLQAVDQHIRGSAAAFASTYAGQVAKFTKSFEDLKVMVGDRLLPTMQEATKIIIADLEALQGHFDDLGHSVVGSFGLLLKVVTILVPSFKPASDALNALISPTKDAAGAAGKLGGALDGLNGSMDRNKQAVNAAISANASLRDKFLGLIGAARTVESDQRTLTQLQRQGKQGTKDYGDAVLQLLQDQSSLDSSTKDYLSTLRAAGASQSVVTGRIIELAKAAGLTAGQIASVLRVYSGTYAYMSTHPLSLVLRVQEFFQGRLTGSVLKGADALRQQQAAQDKANKSAVDAILNAVQQNAALENVGSAAGGAASATNALADAQQKAADAAKAQKQAEDSLRGSLLSLVSASRQVAVDQRNLTALRSQGLQGTQAYSDAELQLLQDELGLGDALKTYLQTLRASGDTMRQAIREIERLGARAGLSKQEVLDLLKGTRGLRLGGSGGGGAGGGGGPGGGRGPNNYSVTVNVHGSVVSQTDLTAAILKELRKRKGSMAGAMGLA